MGASSFTKDGDIEIHLRALPDESTGLLHHDHTKPYIDLTVYLTKDEIKRRSTWWYNGALFLYDPLDKHKDERSFLFKLDFFLLSSACLGYFIKTLNQSNVGTAYLNGMSEFYDMKGNDYNVLVTLWTIGYIIGQIPSSLILHRISARYYLAGLELTWAFLTLLSITPKSLNGMYVLRFLIGLTESGYFPGLEYLLGSWYSKREIGKRAALFGCSGTAAGLVSGPLQQLVLKSSWAHNYIEPFQWMFVIDAAISIPVAIYTLFADPNTPTTTDAFYFTEKDKLVALERRRREGSQLNTREPYTWAKIKSFFNTWHIFAFPALFLCYNNAGQPGTSQAFQLWMKNTLKLDSYYYNTYPIINSAAGIVLSLTVAYLNDFYKSRLSPYLLFLMFGLVVFASSVLAVWDVPIGLHWAAYFLLAIPMTMGQPLIFSWANGMLHHDDMKRNFVVVVTNTLAYVTGAFVPMLTFNQDDAPEFHKGFSYNACLTTLGFILTGVVLFLETRDKGKGEKFGDIDVDTSSDEGYITLR